MSRSILFFSILALACAACGLRDFYTASANSILEVQSVAGPVVAQPSSLDDPAIIIDFYAGQIFGSGPQVAQAFSIQNSKLKPGSYMLVNASCRCKGAFPPSFDVSADGTSQLSISFVANAEDGVHRETLEATYATTNSNPLSRVKLRCTGIVIPEFALKQEDASQELGKSPIQVVIRKPKNSAWANYQFQGSKLSVEEVNRTEVPFDHHDELRIQAIVTDTSETQRVSNRTLSIHVDGHEKWTGKLTLVDPRRIEVDPPKVLIHAVDGRGSKRQATLTSGIPCRLISIESKSSEIRVIEVPMVGPRGELLATQLEFEYQPDSQPPETPKLRVVEGKVLVRVSCRDELIEIPVVVVDNRRIKE